VWKPEGKRPLARYRRRWEDNIKMYLHEVGWWDKDWIDLAQERNAVMNLWIPQIAENCLTS
jgi:hypothetical protein